MTFRTADVQDALRKRYAAPEWAYFTEVGDGTGYETKRHADGLALNLWPSRGMELHGFEIKVSRNDFRREIANPAKAESIARYCDRWWVVAPESVGIVPSELPPTWGLLRLKPDGKWKVDVEAPKLEAVPLTKHFIAAVMRRASMEEPSKAALERARLAGYAEGEKAAQPHLQLEVERLKQVNKELHAREREFKDASGVSLGGWQHTAAEVGLAIRRALDLAKLERDTKAAVEHIARIHETATKEVGR